jgi:hypothetical protein
MPNKKFNMLRIAMSSFAHVHANGYAQRVCIIRSPRFNRVQGCASSFKGSFTENLRKIHAILLDKRGKKDYHMYKL